MSITGALGAVYRSSGVSTVMTGEATTADASKKIFTITATTKRCIDDQSAVTVKVGGTTVTTGFTIYYPLGQIVFDVSQGASVVTVDGKYIPVVQCSTFFSWKLDMSRELKDVTTFNSAGWKEQIAANASWSASCDSYWNDSTFSDLVGTRMAVIFYVNKTNNYRYAGYAYLNKCAVDTPNGDVVKESISFESTSPIVYSQV